MFQSLLWLYNFWKHVLIIVNLCLSIWSKGARAQIAQWTPSLWKRFTGCELQWEYVWLVVKLKISRSRNTSLSLQTQEGTKSWWEGRETSTGNLDTAEGMKNRKAWGHYAWSSWDDERRRNESVKVSKKVWRLKRRANRHKIGYA